MGAELREWKFNASSLDLSAQGSKPQINKGQHRINAEKKHFLAPLSLFYSHYL